MATTLTHASAQRTAQALWTLIEPQPQEVKDILVRIITSPNVAQEAEKPTMGGSISRRLRALKGCMKDIPAEAFADDERAQYILSK